MKSIKKFLFFNIIFMLILGCATSSPEPEKIATNLQKSHPPTYSELFPQQLSLLSEQKRPISKDYKIGPGDLLDISVFGVEDLQTKVRVSSSGLVTLPLIGVISVNGLTSYELEKKIEKVLGKKYIYNPHVTVFIKEYKSIKITVLGAIKNPKVYEVPRDIHLMEIISMAGGLTEEAGDKIYINRPMKKSNRWINKQITIDMEDLFKKGNPQANILLKSGDIVHIAKGGTVYVIGEVKKPGAYSIKGRMTVTQALAEAGGLTNIAALKGKIFRMVNGVNKKIPIDIGEMMK
ncbi:MAG: hypothetical protein DRG20_05135, partial [Deltaproteobacteria bacterium]